MLALGAGCTLVARTIDIDLKHQDQMMLRAADHRGTSLVEIYQDCNIYNHQSWFYASQKDTRPENTVVLEHGKPLVFGKANDKGIRLNGTRLEVVQLGNRTSEGDLLVHDETNGPIAYMLAQMAHPDFPEPIGVLYCDESRAAYDDAVHAQIKQVIEKRGAGDLKTLLHETDTWTVNGK
jgi:2-oxoglutarate ferredoxin oxidoreductase subunit beta